MSRPGWDGRTIKAALAHVIQRDGDSCAICDHPGANSIDHDIPVLTRPDLEWDPTNWKASHQFAAGQTKGCTIPACKCPGNVGRGAVALSVIRAIIQSQNPEPSSRDW